MVVAAFLAIVVAPSAGASPMTHSVLKVPSQYSTIQGAINAARPGDTIQIGPGTYVEQLSVHKTLTITGAGAGKTTIESPAVVTPDPFGNPWTVEIGHGATVSMSGFTLLVTPQCIVASGVAPDPTVHPHVDVFAGGGIGVGGTAVLHLKSAVVTTSGATEGASCGSNGFMSFGTGIDFGLDYASGAPAASHLIGSGTVTAVTISGFGFGGPGVSVGGQADSPAGSSAVLSADRITTSADESGIHVSPAVSVGFGGNASTATVTRSVISAQPSLLTDVVEVFSGSSAKIALNSILDGPEDDAIVVYASTADITFNSISGSTADLSGGVILEFSSASVTYNLLTDFECSFNATYAGLGLCGPSFSSQAQVLAIADLGDAGLGTLIAHNVVSSSDVGVMLYLACSGCVVKGNLFVNNSDYALLGLDGNVSFGPNVIVGGSYGVASIAVSTNTTVTLSHVRIFGSTVAAYYYESDCLAFFGYSCSTSIV